MGKNSDIAEKLNSFIVQYMTPDEFLAFTSLLMLLMIVSMVTYVIYSVVKNEKSAKKLRIILKKDDIVRVHGIRSDCTVEEINGKDVIVKVKVPLNYIYTKNNMEGIINKTNIWEYNPNGNRNKFIRIENDLTKDFKWVFGFKPQFGDVVIVNELDKSYKVTLEKIYQEELNN